jgi:hypothetical protein
VQSDTEDASKEVQWMHAVSKAVAQSHLQDGGSAAKSSAEFRSKGLQEVADALIKHEAQWAGHSLGDMTAIKALAEQAQEQHGQAAAGALNEEAGRLFKANAIARAVVKWRAAIWLLFSKELCTDLYYLWDILNSRHTLWEKVCVRAHALRKRGTNTTSKCMLWCGSSFHGLSTPCELMCRRRRRLWRRREPTTT